MKSQLIALTVTLLLTACNPTAPNTTTPAPVVKPTANTDQPPCRPTAVNPSNIPCKTP
jgi:hypothetical protein